MINCDPSEGSADLRSIRKGLGRRLIRQAVQGATRRGSTTTTIDCLVSLTSFVSLLVQKIGIVFCGGLDSAAL